MERAFLVSDPVLSAILVICLLPTVAKVMSQLRPKIGLSGVVGEIFAGVILGPYHAWSTSVSEGMKCKVSIIL